MEFCAKLPTAPKFLACRNQLVRSGTSPGTNYRAACRAKSTVDFINILKIVEEETDESQYWLEIVVAIGPQYRDEALQLWKEADEIVAMTVYSIKKNREKLKTEKGK